MQPFPGNCPLGFCQGNGWFLGSPHLPAHLASNSSLWNGGQASENGPRWPLSTGPATRCLAQHCHHLTDERTDVGSKGCRCTWEEGPWPLCFDGTLTTVSEAPLSSPWQPPTSCFHSVPLNFLCFEIHWPGCYHVHPHGSMEPSLWFLGVVGEGELLFVSVESILRLLPFPPP